MNNPAFNTPSTGTAGESEVERQFADDRGQRDDREATTPLEDLAARHRSDGVPDGFRWGKTAAGKPMIVPTPDNIAGLHELASEIFEDREQRDAEMPRDAQLTKSLNNTAKQLGKANEFLGTGLSFQLARAYAQEFANAVNWIRIHAQNVHRHQQNGNEDAAENSLINLESSRVQAFKAAQVLDWCQDQGAEINILKGCQDALNLAGWRLMNQVSSQNNKQVQQTTRDLIWSRGAKQPDEELEASEEELDEALGTE